MFAYCFFFSSSFNWCSKYDVYMRAHSCHINQRQAKIDSDMSATTTNFQVKFINSYRRFAKLCAEKGWGLQHSHNIVACVRIFVSGWHFSRLLIYSWQLLLFVNDFQAKLCIDIYFSNHKIHFRCHTFLLNCIMTKHSFRTLHA